MTYEVDSADVALLLELLARERTTCATEAAALQQARRNDVAQAWRNRRDACERIEGVLEAEEVFLHIIRREGGA